MARCGEETLERIKAKGMGHFVAQSLGLPSGHSQAMGSEGPSVGFTSLLLPAP